MARMSAFQAFLKEFQIEAGEPASETELRKAESKLGFALPESVRSCYLLCDGGQAKDGSDGPRSALELLSLKATLDYPRVGGFFDSCWSYFPFVENNDSNPVSVCCKSPLVGYVVLVLYDDLPRLMFRSLDGFFQSAIEYVQSGAFLDTYELPSEFTGPERTKNDMSIARELIDLATKRESHEQERIDALRFACDLLSDEDVDEIGKLLNDEDEYVRDHASRRLQRIPGAKAKKALSDLEGDFDSFVERCAQRLQGEGINGSVQDAYGKKTIRIDPGPIWLNMEAFFSERKRPDFDAHLIERSKFFVEYEKKQNKQ
ncbi:MAG: SMI1/KNR4 family protein [Gemmataceae bacterium]|nr:SMI1/KNR4 family protein [Gemmataceae bacterium]